MKNRVLSILLTIAMLLSMIPTYAMASTVPEIYVDTTSVGEVKAGDSVSVSVAIKNNPGIAAAGLTITVPDVLTYVGIVNDSNAGTCAYENGVVAWAFSNDYDTNFTSDGSLFTLNFTVNEDVVSGNYDIEVGLTNNNADNLYNADFDNVTATFTPGTITIAGETADTLSITNGTQSWTAENYSALQAIMADGTGLSAPATSGYYFAGFFSGLTADGTYITEENGYYVLSAAAIGTSTGKIFTGVTELRPRYDAAPENGEYKALWVKNTFSGQILYASMQVLPASQSITVTCRASSDNTALGGDGATMLNADFTAVGGNGYVKLLTNIDLTSTDVNVQVSNVSHFDLNGRKLSSGNNAILGTSNTVEGTLRSSYGNGTLDAGSDSAANGPFVAAMIAGTFAEIRDIDVVGEIRVVANATLKLIENCTVSRNNDKCFNLLPGAVISEISHCTITGRQAFYILGSGANESKILNVHDTVITQPADLTGYSYMPLIRADLGNTASAMIQLGENCTLESKSDSALLYNGYWAVGDSNYGLITVEFTSTNVTMTSPSGNPLPEQAGAYEYILPAGYIIQQGSGKAEFVQGYKISYYSVDNELLYKESVVAGEASAYADYTVDYPLSETTNYLHTGWSLTAGGEAISGEWLPNADTNLYALRKEVTAAEAALASVTVGDNTTYYGTIAEALSYIKTNYNNQSANAVELDIYRDVTVGSNFDGYIVPGDLPITIDLNGNTLKFNCGSSQLCLDVSGANNYGAFTIKSTGAQGKIDCGSAQSFVGQWLNDSKQIHFENVSIDASKTRPYYGGTIELFHSADEITVELTLKNVESVGAGSMIMPYFADKNSSFDFTFENCKLEYTDGYIVNPGWDDAPNNLTVTVTGADTEFTVWGNEEEGYVLPINIKTGTLNLPEGCVLSDNETAGTYTLHTHEYNSVKYDASGHWNECACGAKQSEEVTAHADTDADGVCDGCEYAMGLIIGGSEVTDTSEPEATITEGNTSVEVKNAEQLGTLDSLTVTSKENVVLKFLADALDKIAENVTGNAQISVESKATTIDGAVARYDFNVTSGDTEVEFNGSVEVKVPFTPASGKNANIYRAWHMKDDDTKEALDTVITGDDTNGWFASFTMPHFSGAEIAPAAETGYIAGLNSTTTAVYTGGNVTVNVGVSSAGSDTQFNAAEIVVTFPNDLLTLVTTDLDTQKTAGLLDYKTEVGGTTTTLTIEQIGALKTFATDNFVLNFTAKAEGTATVTLTGAAFAHEDIVDKKDLQTATLNPASVEINIDVETVQVDLPEDTNIDGATETPKGEDYTFTVTQDPYYDYEVKATIGEETITLTGEAGADNVYTYTIDSEKVIGDITIEVTKTAQKFDLTIVDKDGKSTTTADGLTYNESYTFEVPEPQSDKYTVTYAIKRGTADYTGATVGTDGMITIPGTDITDNFTITFTETQTKFDVTVGEGMTGTITGGTGTDGTFQKDDKPVLTIDKKPGYKYTVTAVDAEGNNVAVIMNDDGTYTTEEGINSDITFTVVEEMIGTVQVYNYLTLNADDTSDTDSKTMFLVTYTNEELSGYGDETTTYVPYYGASETNPMLWSDKYNAYCWLVIVDNGTLSADDAAKEVRIASGTKENVDYGMDINGTDKIDAADAQFVYNMYNAKYSNFETVGIAKFLAADQNAVLEDSSLTNVGIQVTDATAIISAILDGSAE